MPLFVARAGLDAIPTMNDSIDRFIARAIRENANVFVMNHPAGVHGFDNQNDDDRSREIMEAMLTFLRPYPRRCRANLCCADGEGYSLANPAY